MSLETAFAELTTQVKRVADLLEGRLVGGVGEDTADPTPAPDAKAAPAAKGAVATKTKAAPAAKGPTLEELQDKAIAFISLDPTYRARMNTEVWAKFGVKKALEVKEGNRAEAIALFDAMIAEHQAANPEV